MNDPYTDKMRELQARFGTRALADRMVEMTRRGAFTEDDRAYIESRPFFFLATADADGAPDSSYKGLLPGHLRVTGPASLSFPSLDGNGMFRSLGNILANPQVGMLFLDFSARRRLRVNGRARIEFEDERLADIPGADLMVHVDATAIFPNCPRYIQPDADMSPDFDRGDGAPTPAWKLMPHFAEVLPKEPK